MRRIESYATPDGKASRFWARQRLLVGGRILGADDGAFLRRVYGVTHVLSVELEHDDEESGFHPAARLRVPFPDSEHPEPIPPFIIGACVGFARGIMPRTDSVLYLHCMMGGARAPAIAYAILLSAGADLIQLPRGGNLFEAAALKLGAELRAELTEAGANLRPVFLTSIHEALSIPEPPTP